MYQFGALAALQDFAGGDLPLHALDLYVGTSAGSVVASVLANGVTPDAACRSVMHGAPNEAMRFQRKDIYSIPWRNVPKTIGRFFRLLPAAFHAWRVFGGLPSVVDALTALQEALPAGMFSNEELEKFLQRAFRAAGGTDDFRRLRAKLFVTAVELDTGDRRVFGAEGSEHVPISLAVRASCALPILFEPVSVEGMDYIDGGMRRVAHMDLATKEGADLVLVFHPGGAVRNDRRQVCIPMLDGHCATMREKGVVFVAEQAERVLNDMRFALDIHTIEHGQSGTRVLVFQPEPTETLFFLQSALTWSTRAVLLNYAYNITMSQIERECKTMTRVLKSFGVRADPGRLRRNKYLVNVHAV